MTIVALTAPQLETLRIIAAHGTYPSKRRASYRVLLRHGLVVTDFARKHGDRDFRLTDAGRMVLRAEG